MSDGLQRLRKVFGAASVREAAERIGLDHTGLKRRLESRQGASIVIELARAYGEDPVTCLVEYGYLTHDEATDGDVENALREVGDLELALEIVRRLEGKDAERGGTLDAPLDESFGQVVPLTVDDATVAVTPPAAKDDKSNGEPASHAPTS